MEQHPYLGFNYRISELHAAVGLAQMRKIETIRADKRRNKAQLKSILAQNSKVSFRPMPDPEGDSGTFLNIFLPSQKEAQAVVDGLAAKGIGGANYWFTNMYHFINQWDHLKELRSAAPLAIHALGAPQDYSNLQLPKSQDAIGRLISFGVRGTWSEEEINTFGNSILEVINEVTA